MHTKYRNLERLNKLAKHWRFNISPDPREFATFFKKTCNYENLLSDREIDKEIKRIHSLIPNVKYGVETGPIIQVSIMLQSGDDTFLRVYIYGKDIDSVKKEIMNFKEDYRNSIFKVTQVVPVVLSNGLMGSFSYLSEKDHNEVMECFSDILNVESTRFVKEEAYLKRIHYKHQLVEKLEDWNFKYALRWKILLIACVGTAIYHLQNSSVLGNIIWVYLIVSIFKKHAKQAQIDRQKEFMKEFKKFTK